MLSCQSKLSRNGGGLGWAMQQSHSFWACGLVGAFVLFGLGSEQTKWTWQFKADAAISRKGELFGAAHAPNKLVVAPNGTPSRGPHNEFTSNNWSGYALTAGGYTSASFSWTVPTVTFASYPSNPGFESSSSWVGVGGFATGDLIQLGTEQYITSAGSTIYRPWYELLPASETDTSATIYCSPR